MEVLLHVHLGLRSHVSSLRGRGLLQAFFVVPRFGARDGGVYGVDVLHAFGG